MIPKSELLVCKICQRSVQTMGGLLSHITRTHRISQHRYYEDFFHNPCEQCGKRIPFLPGVHGRLAYVAKRRWCSGECFGMANAKPPRPNQDGYLIHGIRAYPRSVWPLLIPMKMDRKGADYRVFVHRAVMAIKIGRALKPGESVHHINGIRTDNRPENLELFVTTHLRGVRSSDLLCPHCGKAYHV